MSSGYVLHAFDVIDVGHIDLVRQVRDRVLRVVVGVLTDEQVQILTGRPPVIPLRERLTLVSHLRGVDHAVVHDDARVPAGSVVFVEPGGLELWPGAVPVEPRTRTTSSLLRAGTREVA